MTKERRLRTGYQPQILEYELTVFILGDPRRQDLCQWVKVKRDKFTLLLLFFLLVFLLKNLCLRPFGADHRRHLCQGMGSHRLGFVAQV